MCSLLTAACRLQAVRLASLSLKLGAGAAYSSAHAPDAAAIAGKETLLHRDVEELSSIPGHLDCLCLFSQNVLRCI